MKMINGRMNRLSAKTLIEHWNGASWSVVKSPTPNGVTALGDGTVVMVSSNGAIVEK